MSVNKNLAVVAFLLLLVFGCSKKKEEAAELEKELMGQQDTVAEVTTAPADTAGPQEAISTAPRESEPPIPSTPAVSGYTVQVAGCEDQAYAEHLVEVYTERGYEPYLTTATVGSQTYYRVRLGSFESLSEAKALKSELKDRFSLDAWIDYVD